MLRSHGTLRLSALILISLFPLSCGSVHNSDEYFVFVSANIQLPYWKTAGSGFSHAAAEFKGIRFDFTGPQSYDPKAERDALDLAVQKKATGILLSVADASVLKTASTKPSPPPSRSLPSIPTLLPANACSSSEPTTTRQASPVGNGWPRS